MLYFALSSKLDRLRQGLLDLSLCESFAIVALIAAKTEKAKTDKSDQEGQETTMQRGKCKTCGALIFWIVTPSGKKAPIDANKSEGSSVWVLDANASGDLSWRLTNGIGHASHFATCPNAEQHRRKEK